MTKQGKVTKDLISPTKCRTTLWSSLHSGPPTRHPEICYVCSIPSPSLSFTDISPHKPLVLQTLSQLLLPRDITSTDTDITWDLWQWPKVEKRPYRWSHKTFDGGRGKRTGHCVTVITRNRRRTQTRIYWVPTMCQELYKCYYSVFVTSFQNRCCYPYFINQISHHIYPHIPEWPVLHYKVTCLQR